MSKITSFTADLTTTIPGVDVHVPIVVESDVYEGMLIKIPTGAPMFKLHDLILNGLVTGISFYSEPAKEAPL